MENSPERSPERIPTRDLILEVISRFAENHTLVRELSDEQGLYLLEAKVEGIEPGETTQYEYIRRGSYPDGNQSLETIIHVVYYENGMPVGGHNVSKFDSDTGTWADIA